MASSLEQSHALPRHPASYPPPLQTSPPTRTLCASLAPVLRRSYSRGSSGFAATRLTTPLT
eukprot:6207828-Pleurochrysis_carterae.AAC.2